MKIKHILTAALVALIALAPVLQTPVYAGSLDTLTDAEKNSSYGFFVWMSENAETLTEREDAAVAAQILTNNVSDKYSSLVFNNGTITGGSGSITYQDLLDATDIGAEYDATALDNLRQAIDYVTTGNNYRAKEHLAALQISSGMMAMAEINANYQNNETLDHSSVFYALENLAYAQIGGTWQYGTFDGASDDPYEGWYTKEKANYDANNGGVTGHYKTLTDRQGVMLITGFGVRDRFVDTTLTASDGKDYPVRMHDRYYSQHFSNADMYYLGTGGVTPEKYTEYLNRYTCEVVGHQWDEGTVTTEPTCKSKGVKTYTCTVCGETKTEEIGYSGHTLTMTDARRPRCTTDGNTEYYTCSVCGKYFSDEEGTNEIEENSWILPACHTWETKYTVDKEATCAEEGSESIHCGICGAIDESTVRTIAKTEHTYGDWKTETEPSCTEAGLRAKTCSGCGDKIEEEIPATGHAWADDYTVDKEATHTTEGVESIHCTKCGAIKEGSERVIPVTDHVFSDWVVTKAATCTETGSKTHKCTECGLEETVEIPATGHKWASEYTVDTEPTCTSEGSESIHCTECGAIKEGSAKVIAKTAHSFGDWTVLTEATYTEEGLREHTCSVCNETEQEVIPVKTRVSIKKAAVSKVYKKVYTGKALTQAPVVKLGSVTLKKGTDYKLSYKNNKNVGTATVVITGINGYTGSISKAFVINPKATKINKVAAAKKAATVKWSKQAVQTSGYQIQYGLKSSFKGAKTVTVSKNKTVSLKIKNLKSKKKYYFRIRTFRKVGSKKYWSAWSGAKSVKVK